MTDNQNITEDQFTIAYLTQRLADITVKYESEASAMALRFRLLSQERDGMVNHLNELQNQLIAAESKLAEGQPDSNADETPQ